MNRTNDTKKLTAMLLAAVLLLMPALAGCARGNGGGDDMIGIPNPKVNYESLEAVNAAAGVSIARPFADAADESFGLISGTLAEYRFTRGGIDYIVRAAKTEDDISGVYVGDGTVFANEAPSEIPAGYEGDGFVAMRWFVGDIQYVVLAKGDNITYEAVRDPIMELAAPTIPGGTVYYSLEGNYRGAEDDRIVMYVGSVGNAVRVFINESLSASGWRNWQMTCRLDGTSVLAYEDCVSTDGVYGDDRVYRETVRYENGLGYLTVRDGVLLWNGAAEEEYRSLAFTPVDPEN